MTTVVEFQSNYDIEALAREWQDLESRVRPTFFLSWAWIGCLLSETGARPILVRAKRTSETIALGLLARHRRRRHALNVRQLRLNETGIPEHDRLTIEHNGFLAASDASDEILKDISHAKKQAPILGDWDEIGLSGGSSTLADAAAAAGLNIEIDRSSADYRVELSNTRHGDINWLSRRSSNLRAQLRQARASAEQLGKVRLTAARTVDEALAFFDAMRRLHDEYWRSRQHPGAFDSEFALRFHRSLVSAHTDDGGVELLRLTAGDEQLGYLYNFICCGTVFNYQSGFSYSKDNRHRPGLLAHAMAIERAVLKGYNAYDFLAGDASYKSRLGENAGSLLWCRAQRARPALVVERMARRTKQVVVRLLGRS